MTDKIPTTSHLVLPIGSFEYPEGPMSEAIEAQIARTLPPLAGLDAATTLTERVKVYEQAIEVQLAEFVALHGNPFGQEQAIATRSKAAALAPACR